MISGETTEPGWDPTESLRNAQVGQYAQHPAEKPLPRRRRQAVIEKKMQRFDL